MDDDKKNDDTVEESSNENSLKDQASKEDSIDDSTANQDEKAEDNKDEDTKKEDETTSTSTDDSTSETSTSTTENNSDPTLTEMADNDIIMNFASINDLCSEWSSKVTALNLTGERVVKGLEKLTAYGINDQYASTLATAVNSLSLTMTEVINTIKNANDDQQDADSTYGNGSSSWDKGSGYNYGSNAGNNSDTSSETSINNNNHNAEITVAKLKEKATLNDYIGLSTLLSSIVSTKNSSLDDVLNNFDETQIKNKILSSVNLSDDLKQLLYNSDSTVLKEALIQFYKNGDIKIIDNSSMGILGKYIEKIALKQNMSIEQLLANDSNNKILYNELEYYDKAIQLFGNEKSHETIRDLYDGNIDSNVDDKLITIVRDIVDITAVQNNITAEDVILNSSVMSSVATSKDYISYLKNSTNIQNIFKELYVK